MRQFGLDEFNVWEGVGHQVGSAVSEVEVFVDSRDRFQSGAVALWDRFCFFFVLLRCEIKEEDIENLPRNEAGKKREQ